jgi:hypothetical protein
MGIGGLGIQMRRGGRENRGGWKDLCTYHTRQASKTIQQQQLKLELEDRREWKMRRARH